MSEEEQGMLDLLSGATRLFPIIGDPIKYVESPVHLTRSFAARGHNAVCVPMQVPRPALDDVMCGLSAVPNVDGLLVTMPHKHTAVGQCATTSQRTTLLGAVSVMRRNDDGTWHGDMLDGLAFVKAQKDHGARPSGARVLLLGTGGAGSAIAVALLDEGVRELIVHDVDETRAAELVELLSGHGHRNVATGRPDSTGCDMVCNATPLDMNDDDPLPADADLLTSSMFVGDVIAGHGLTPFLAAAEAAGCSTANGGHMVEAVQELMVDFMLGDEAALRS
jgi:shikimate dehydrogenase